MFRTRLRASLDLLAATGMWRSNYAPPAYRLLWACGLRVPPPHFRSFAANAVSCGVAFGVVWGAMMWLLVWSNERLPSAAGALAASTIAGLLFGVLMAAYYRHGQRKHALPTWSSLLSNTRPRSV